MTTSAGPQRASTGGSAGSGRLAGTERTSSLQLFLRRVLARLIDLLPLALLCAGLWVSGADVLESVAGACDPAPAEDCNVVQENSFIDDAGRVVFQFTMVDGRVIDATHSTYQFGNTTYIADPPEPIVYLAGLAYALVVFVLLQGFTGWTPGKLAAGIRLADHDRRRAGIVRSFLRWALPDGAIGVIGVLIAVAEGPWPLRLLAAFAALGLLRFIGELAPALLGPLGDRRLGVQVVAAADYVGQHADDLADAARPEAPATSEFGPPGAPAPAVGSVSSFPGLEPSGPMPLPMPPPVTVGGPEGQPPSPAEPSGAWPAPQGVPASPFGEEQHEDREAAEHEAAEPGPSPVPSLRSVPDLRPMPSIFEPEPTMEHGLEPADDTALEREFGEAEPVERADATVVSGAGWQGRTTDADAEADADEAQAVQDTGDAAVSSGPGDVEIPAAGAVAAESLPATATPDTVQTHRLGPDIRSFPAPPLAGPEATPTPTPTVPDEAAQAAEPAASEPADAFADTGTPGGEERIDVESPIADLGDAGPPATEPPVLADVADVTDVTEAVEEPEAAEPAVGAAATEAEPAASNEPAEAGAVGAGVGAPASSPADSNTAALADAASAAANMASNPYRPQWDAARHAYICWEPVSSQWLQWDDAGEVWGPISQ